MVLLVASSLALLVVYAGIKLLIQCRKETLGVLYRCASWFFIASGLLILLTAGACCIAMCCNYGMHMMMNKKQGHMGAYHGHYRMDEREMDDYKGHKRMQKCYQDRMDGCGMQKCCQDKTGGCGNATWCSREKDDCCQQGDHSCKRDTSKTYR